MGKRGFHVAATVGLVAGLLAMMTKVKAYGKGMEAVAICEAVSGYRYDLGTWNWKNMSFTLPTVIGVSVSMVGSKAGLNRYMPKGLKL